VNAVADVGLMKTTKSPRRVLETGFACAQRALPRFAHRYSPKKFTQHQLFACLTLKEFLKLDYRGVMQLLIDSPDLCGVIGLADVPHWTTLQKAADRLLKKTPLKRSSIKRLRSPARRDSFAAARG
jgi:hypothetical protein